MKSYKYILIVIFLGLFGACEDLEPTIYSDLTTANAYDSADDAKAAITAVYSALKPYGYFYYDGYQKVITDFTTDVGHARAGGDINKMSYFRWDPTNRYFKYAWRFIYKMISNANIAIDNIEQIEMDQALKTRYIAEARMIRAIGYIDLTDAWGPVPLVLSSELNVDEEIPPSPVADINAQIVADLEFAVQNLPTTYEGADAARATKGAANGFLCKFYMREHNWQKALEHANAVMGLADQGIYELNPSINDLHSEGNKLDKEHLFAVLNETGQTGALLTKHAGPSDHPEVSAWQYYAVSLHFWNKFDDADPRKEFFWYNYTGKSGRYYKMPEIGETTPPDDNTILIPDVATKKFSNNMVSVSYEDGFTFPVLRLADIILSKAEILNELNGPNAESLALINQIRNRAGAPAISETAGDYTKETLRNALCDERGFELYFECKRRADLIRMGKYIETCNTYLEAIGENPAVSEKYKLFPYPQDEVNTNSHLDNSGRTL